MNLRTHVRTSTGGDTRFHLLALASASSEDCNMGIATSATNGSVVASTATTDLVSALSPLTDDSGGVGGGVTDFTEAGSRRRLVDSMDEGDDDPLLSLSLSELLDLTYVTVLALTYPTYLGKRRMHARLFALISEGSLRANAAANCSIMDTYATPLLTAKDFSLKSTCQRAIVEELQTARGGMSLLRLCRVMLKVHPGFSSPLDLRLALKNDDPYGSLVEPIFRAWGPVVAGEFGLVAMQMGDRSYLVWESTANDVEGGAVLANCTISTLVATRRLISEAGLGSLNTAEVINASVGPGVCVRVCVSPL